MQPTEGELDVFAQVDLALFWDGGCRLANTAVVMEFAGASAEIDMGTRKP